MALSGTLEDLSFAEIVQVINQGHKTGDLIIRRKSEQARIYFADGEIIHASMTAPPPASPVEGAEVVYRLLGWKEGDFEFKRIRVWVVRNITESTDELVLEGMKRLDEWEHVQEEITDWNVVLRLRAGNVGDQYDELTDAGRTILRLVDARRNVADIIRESGFDPNQALVTIGELIGLEMVEKWDSSSATSARLTAPTVGLRK